MIQNVNCYDIDQANIGEYLSGAAYCGKDKYKTMQLAGPASGFVYQDTLYGCQPPDWDTYIRVGRRLRTEQTFYIYVASPTVRSLSAPINILLLKLTLTNIAII